MSGSPPLDIYVYVTFINILLSESECRSLETFDILRFVWNGRFSVRCVSLGVYFGVFSLFNWGKFVRVPFGDFYKGFTREFKWQSFW